MPLPRGGGGTRIAAPAAPAAAPEPKPAPPASPPSSRPGAAEAARTSRSRDLPELDASARRPEAELRDSPAAARARAPGRAGPAGQRCHRHLVATPGLAIGPPGPGVPDGTDSGGDWYLAGVQRKIWMLWNQQIKAGFRQPVPSPSRSSPTAASPRCRSCPVERGVAAGHGRAARGLLRRPFAPLPKNYGTNRNTIQASSSRRRSLGPPSRPCSCGGRSVPGESCPEPPPPQRAAQIVIGGERTAGFAVPDCIPLKSDDASREVCRTVTQVLRTDQSSRGCSSSCPRVAMGRIPALNPERPELRATGAPWGPTCSWSLRAQVDGRAARRWRRRRTSWTAARLLPSATRGGPTTHGLFAHQASDDIVALTQYRGVARTGSPSSPTATPPRSSRSKELYIVDYDGFNPRRVTSTRVPEHPARVEPRRAFPRLRVVPPRLARHLLRLHLRREERELTTGSGQASRPRGALTASASRTASNRGGNMEIWVANADGTDAAADLTAPRLDTAPTWSPTGPGDRVHAPTGSGTPQIYVMDTEGLNVRRLTTVGNWNDAPAWNPSKQFSEIAYTSRLEGGRASRWPSSTWPRGRYGRSPRARQLRVPVVGAQRAGTWCSPARAGPHLADHGRRSRRPHGARPRR